MSRQNPDNALDILKLLLERSHAEARLYWVRNNVFYAVNTTLLGATIIYFFPATEEGTRAELVIPSFVQIIVCLIGLMTSVIWLAISVKGKKMNHAYMDDAKKLANENNILKQHFSHSLISNETPSSGLRKFLDPLFERAATDTNHTFILLYCAAWTILLVWKVCF